MKVKELIEQLTLCNQEAEVLITALFTDHDFIIGWSSGDKEDVKKEDCEEVLFLVEELMDEDMYFDLDDDEYDYDEDFLLELYSKLGIEPIEEKKKKKEGKILLFNQKDT